MENQSLCEKCESWVLGTKVVMVKENRKISVMILCEKCEKLLDGIEPIHNRTYSNTE
jgi:hypothetical protein